MAAVLTSLISLALASLSAGVASFRSSQITEYSVWAFSTPMRMRCVTKSWISKASSVFRRAWHRALKYR